MRITLLTPSSKEFWPVMKLSAPNKLEYCLRHEIQLSIRQHVEEIKSSWSVINEREHFMIDALKECDWLFFMGGDTLIMDMTVDIRKFIDKDYHLIIGTDVYMINNDVFFLKNCPESFEFLNTVLEYNKTMVTDQHSMEKAIVELPNFKTKIVHNRTFNSYFDGVHDRPEDRSVSYQEGDPILHFTGMPNSRRIPLMTEYLTKVKR